MDWTKLTDSLKPLKEKAAPFLEKAKDAGFKAMDYTQKQLQNTPIVLKTLDELTELRTKKRVVLITYDQEAISNRDIILRSPMWSAQAWSDAAELRFVEVSTGGDIVSHLNINTPVDMRVWFVGEETFHATDTESILKWWKTRCYDGKEEPTQTPPENEKKVADPLSGK